MSALIAKWKWVISALVCFLILYLIPDYWIERYYALFLFKYIRKFFDFTFGRLPFPALYLFIGFILIVIIKWLLYFFGDKPLQIRQHIFKALSFAGFMITLFFLLWGFNYGRISLEKKLNLQIEHLSVEEIKGELDATVSALITIRNSIQKDTLPIPQIVFINNIESNCLSSLNAALDQFGYDTAHVRGRIVFEDMFMVFNVGGMYMPYVGEGNIDEAVYYTKKPFYLIHEMAHGNGFTNESDCNFLAYISGVQSNNLSLQYSAEMNYLLYLMEELRALDEEVYTSSIQEINEVLLYDLRYMKEHYLQHQFKTGFLGELVNNLYLKTLKVKEGTKSYDRMVLLVNAWKRKNLK